MQYNLRSGVLSFTLLCIILGISVIAPQVVIFAIALVTFWESLRWLRKGGGNPPWPIRALCLAVLTVGLYVVSYGPVMLTVKTITNRGSTGLGSRVRFVIYCFYEPMHSALYRSHARPMMRWYCESWRTTQDIPKPDLDVMNWFLIISPWLLVAILVRWRHLNQPRPTELAV